MTGALAAEFRTRAVHHLRDEFLPRIERAVARLDAEDVWWRPHETCTSVGNLLLHLEGNVRQWILGGLGGHPDERRRSAEFLAREGATPDELLTALRTTVEDACAVIADLPAEALLEKRPVQVFDDVSGLAAVMHVVEHFSWHTGQIAWITKLRTARELGYYEGIELD